MSSLAWFDPHWAHLFILLAAMAGAVTTAYLAQRRRQRLHATLRVNERAIAAWSSARGWQVADATDPSVMALAREALDLVSMAQRHVGAVVFGGAGSGRVVVVESFTHQGKGRDGLETTILLDTDATVRPGRARMTETGAVDDLDTVVRTEQGATVPWAPSPVPPELAAALAGLRVGAVVQTASGRLALHVPGAASSPRVADALERLLRLEQALPRAPAPTLETAARRAAQARRAAKLRG